MSVPLNEPSKFAKQERRSKVPLKKEEGRKLKVLCLHGYRQNEVTFREKLGAFRKLVGKHVDFFFFSSPVKVPPSTEDEADPRGWWFSQPAPSFEAHERSDCDDGFSGAVAAVAEFAALHGPFDGLMSFSQGAAFHVILSLMQEMGELAFSFNFGILVAPFRSRSSKHDHWFDGGTRISIPSLLVMGETDKVIEKEMSDEVAAFFENKTALVHPGGHFVPANSQNKKVYLEFLEERKREIS